MEHQTDNVRLLFQINRKMVNTIGFRDDLIRFRKDFTMDIILFPVWQPLRRGKVSEEIVDAIRRVAGIFSFFLLRGENFLVRNDTNH